MSEITDSIFKVRKYVKSRGIELDTFETVVNTPLDQLFPTIAVVVVTRTGKIGVGTSVCSPDDKLNYDFGVKQARDRAIEFLINSLETVEQGENLESIEELAYMEAEVARQKAIQAKREWLTRETNRSLGQLEKQAAKYGFKLNITERPDLPAGFLGLPSDLVEGDIDGLLAEMFKPRY